MKVSLQLLHCITLITHCLLVSNCNFIDNSVSGSFSDKSPSLNSNNLVIEAPETSNVTFTGFDWLANYSGDLNGNAIVQACFCNATDVPSCDPSLGVCAAMIRGSQNFSLSTTGLSNPNNAGENLNLILLAMDVDGVSENSLVGQVTLVSPSLFTQWDQAGAGDASSPYEIWTKAQLLDIGNSACNDLASIGCNKHFILMGNIDLENELFTPIGFGSNPFIGNFDGNSKSVIGLNINQSNSKVGFIGELLGTISQLTLTGTVQGESSTGMAVGLNSLGTVSRVSVHGTVLAASGVAVGGLVGRSTGGLLTISTSYVDVQATTISNVGGLVGACDLCSITSVMAFGNVSGDANVGGLAGSVDSTVTDSAAFGDVLGTGDSVGGLIGQYSGSATGLGVMNSYARGAVTTPGTDVGGLVGLIDGGFPTVISSSYASGDVRGYNSVGGFVGRTDASSTRTIADSAAYGNVYGNDDVGGFGGDLRSTTLTGSQAHGQVNTSGLLGRQTGGFIGVSYGGNTIQYNRYYGEFVSGTAFIGGFIGLIAGSGTIDHNSVRGWPLIDGYQDTGGFAGRNNGPFSYAYVEAHVRGGQGAGGLSGGLYNSVSNSFAKVSVYSYQFNAGGIAGAAQSFVSDVGVIGTIYGNDRVGGMFGEMSGGSVTRSYARAKVVGVTNQFAVVGGTPVGSLDLVYWDSDSSILNGSAAAVEDLTHYEKIATSDMLSQAQFVGFDFGSVWNSTNSISIPLPSWLPESRCRTGGATAAYNAIGGGTASDPWLICNVNQWVNLINNACGVVTTHCDKFYALGANIDFKKTFPGQIGQAKANCFAGNFDGNNMIVSNVFYNGTNPDWGLFACVTGKIRNIRFQNLVIKSGEARGLLTSYSFQTAEIVNIHIQGVSGMNPIAPLGGSDTGGIVGTNAGGLVAHSSFTGEIYGNERVGGIVGNGNHPTSSQIYNRAIAAIPEVSGSAGLLQGSGTDATASNLFHSIIHRSAAMGSITSSLAGSQVGGLSGFGSHITESFAAVNIVSSTTNEVGGLAASNAEVNNSNNITSLVSGATQVGGAFSQSVTGSFNYAVVDTLSQATGSFLEFINSTSTTGLQACYYDSDVVGSGVQNDPGRIEPLTTVNTKALASYSGWNFAGNGPWSIAENRRSPQLRWRYQSSCFSTGSSNSYNAVGDGSVIDPYVICYKAQLLDISANACGPVANVDCDKYFILGANIDLEEDPSYVPIGSQAFPFTGSFNGFNHTISRLKINNSNSYQGFFGSFDGATIFNLNIVAADIAAIDNVGILGGSGGGFIQDIFVSGKVSGSVSNVGGLLGSLNTASQLISSRAQVAVVGVAVTGIGGLIGKSNSSATTCFIYDSFVSGTLAATGVSLRSGGFIGDNHCNILTSGSSMDINVLGDSSGGFVGLFANTFAARITNSYSTGTIVGTAGFVGRIESSAIISNSWTTSSVTQNNPAGFVGVTIGTSYNLFNNYAANTLSGGGTLAGFSGNDSGGTFNDNFWNSTLSLVSTGASAGEFESLSTFEMQDEPNKATNFPNWQFTDKWYFIDGGFPQLRY